MAIDTADKRAAGINTWLPWQGILPEADGAVGDLSDRQFTAFSYPSLSAAGVYVNLHKYLYWSGTHITQSNQQNFALVDSVSAPTAVAGYGIIWLDSTVGDVRIIFADGEIRSLSGRLKVVSKTSTYTITASDDVILCSGTFTVTLPTASGIAGTTYHIKNNGTGTLTIDGDGSETIDGATTQTITAQYDSIQVVSDGTGWAII